MTPAAAIDAALAAAGIATKQERAKVVGEYATHWGRYVAGGRHPQTSKVQRWLECCAVAGHPVRLRWDTAGARVV